MSARNDSSSLISQILPSNLETILISIVSLLAILAFSWRTLVQKLAGDDEALVELLEGLAADPLEFLDRVPYLAQSITILFWAIFGFILFSFVLGLLSLQGNFIEALRQNTYHHPIGYKNSTGWRYFITVSMAKIVRTLLLLAVFGFTAIYALPVAVGFFQNALSTSESIDWIYAAGSWALLTAMAVAVRVGMRLRIAL